MTAVIYARYSSDNQREESIEGQIRECTAYAEKNGITIVKHYIDRAISAKTDNRPEFQQMIKDSDKKLFDIVLVWKLDRFARNRYDSARYKTQLKRNGVKLVSATEVISAGPEGIILESVLEGYAEYYSADLSEKVVRGMTENALKGIYNGGTIPFGYMIDETRHYQPDPLLAPYVEQTFQKYADGATMTDLRDWLKAHKIKNSMGGEMSYNTIQRILSNRRYIGELRLRDVVQPNAIPALVSEDLFNKVQEKLAKNKKAPARHKAEESYLLTTKLYCGKCGALMFGESGVSHTGKMYTYYKCAAAKKKKTCDKKAVRKQWLEDLVVNETMKLVEDDASMNAIIAKVMELQNQESTDLPIYEKQLKETEVGITNMLNAIQMGILTSSTKERLEALEEQRKELQARIAEERLAKPKMKEEFVRFWLLRFRKLDMTQPEQRQALVDTFINAIYLYDDKVLITFNYKEGTETVAFGEAVKAEKSSDMSARGAPDIERQIVRFGVLFYYVTTKNRGLHGRCTVFARSAFSWESSAWAGIALKCVVNFASGQQSQTELRLYFGVSILQKFQQSSHGDGRFACGGYSLRAGSFLFSIEPFLKFPTQLHTRGLLDMGVGVYQHICRSVSGDALNSFHIAAGDHQLVGGAGMAQTVEHDARKLRVCILPFTEQHSAVMVTCRVFHLVRRQLIQPLLQFLFQRRGHEDGAAGRRRFGTFQDEGSGTAFQLVREYLDDAAIVHLIQGFFSHPLHGLVDTEGSDAICCVKVKIFRGQTYDLALSQCAHQCEVDCQMQDGVLHAVQSRSHFLYCPNGALLRGLLGAVHRNRAFDKDAPLYGILEGCTQQPMHLVDGGAGKKPLLLFFSQFLLLSLDIRAAGRFAQGRVEVLHVVGLEFLHLHAADIGDNQVLNGGEVGFVGLGCPLVLAALLGQPIHEELCHRHRGRNQESASCQFMLDLLLSVRCLLFCGKTFPFVAALAVFIFVGVSDAVRVAAFRNICHTVASLSSCPVEPRIETVFRDADASAYSQDTEFGGAVAQVVSRAQADGQHSCDLFHRVHQLRGFRAVSWRLDGIGLSDHLHCSGIRVILQGFIRIIFRFHIFGHVRPIQIHRQTSNSL